MSTTTTHPGDVCQHVWTTDQPCHARCAITTQHQCTVDRETHGGAHVCCCDAETETETEDVAALAAQVRELQAELATERGTGRAIARRDGAADALVYASTYVSAGERHLLLAMAGRVRGGDLTIPTTTREES